ncbi:MAG: hypothetical protein ISS19_18110 [Bacteroidales bacterium]|nr:hypothetical protein [Bacteroidales bacterium]
MDPLTGESNNGAIRSFNDTYYFRISETYLIRDEVYPGAMFFFVISFIPSTGILHYDYSFSL